MSGVDDQALRLRAYLLGLTPQARRRLRGELERGHARNAGFNPAAALAELRRLDGDAEGAAARLFFAPLAPFLVDDDPARRHPGRIARGSLAALWAFIGHDLLPHECVAFARAPTDARDFQDGVAAALRDVFGEDAPARRALLARIGTPRAEEEAATLRWALRGRDTLTALGERLPARIGHLPASQIPACIALIEGAARPRDIFVCALIVFMGRLAAPWQIARLAAHAAGSNSAARVGATPYGIAVDILVADIERQIAALAVALAGREGAAAAVGLIRSIDAAIAGLRSEIAIPVGSTLGRRLSAFAAEAGAVARSALAA